MWRLRHQIEAISAGWNQSVALDRLRARAPIEVQIQPLAQAAGRQCFPMSDRLLQMSYRVAYTGTVFLVGLGGTLAALLVNL